MNSIALKSREEHWVGAPVASLAPVPASETVRIGAIAIDLYCSSADVAAELDIFAADRRLARARVQRRGPGIAAAIRAYKGQQTPELIIVEAQASGDALLAEVDALAAVCDESTRVIMIGGSNDLDLYRGLMHRGVSEYLRAPVSSGEVIAAIAQLFADASATRLGRTYAFVGVRGGVGSSTLAHNVASVLGRFSGSEVVLADLDLGCGTAALDFDVNPDRGLADALREHDRLDDQMFERLLFPCGDHLKLLTAPSAFDPDTSVQPDAVEAVIEFARRNASHVVLDVPQFRSDWARKAVLQADEVVVTATPDLVSVRNAGKLIEILRQVRQNDSKPLLVLNQVGVPKRPEIKTSKFADAVGIKPVVSIPFDPRAFGTAANSGRMVSECPNGRRHIGHLRQIGEALARRPLKPRRFGGLRRLFGSR